jgi:putative transposase
MIAGISSPLTDPSRKSPDSFKTPQARFLVAERRMARRKRIQFCGATYHVMSRGNRKGRVFEDDRDRRRFLSIVSEALKRYRAECPGYCLMDTHYHLILHTLRPNLSLFMKLVNGQYTQYANRRHGWTGHVLEGRFKSPIIDDTCYLRTALAYVARNPVEAGYVDAPERWKWSSYASAIGLCTPEPCVSTDWVQKAFPSATLTESRQWFTNLVADFPGELKFHECDVVFGNEGLKSEVRELIGRTMYLSELPRSYRALARPPLREVMSCCTQSERVSAILRAHIVYGYKLSEIAACLDVHPTTISRILSRSRKLMRRIGD